MFAQNQDIFSEEEPSATEQFEKSLDWAGNSGELQIITLLLYTFTTVLVVVLLTIYGIHRAGKSREERMKLACEKFNKQADGLKLNPDNVSLLADVARYSNVKTPSSIFKSPDVFEKSLETFYEKQKKPASNEELAHVRELRQTLGFLPLPNEVAYTSTRQFSDGFRCAVQISGGEKASHKGVCIISNVGENEWSIDRPEGPAVAPGTPISIDITRPGDARYSIKTRVVKDSGDELLLSHSNKIIRSQQRNWARVKVNIVATVTEIGSDRAGEVFTGEIIDMSGGGFGVLSLPAKLQNGSKLSISFDLPGYGSVTVAVKVMRLAGRFGNDPSKIIHGVAFEGDIGRIREQILQYVNERQRQDKMSKRGKGSTD